MTWHQAEDVSLRKALTESPGLSPKLHEFTDRIRIALEDPRVIFEGFLFLEGDQPSAVVIRERISTDWELCGADSAALDRAAPSLHRTLQHFDNGTPLVWFRSGTPSLMPPCWSLARSVEFHAARPYPITARTPNDVSIRTYRPQIDDATWVELNQQAFCDHPEQGRIGHDDFLARTGESWFDRDGLFFAEVTHEALGYCWTKLHTYIDDRRDGEIYAIGVRPGQGRRGIGRALLEAGLEHLRIRGATEWTLHVDTDNVAALELYRSYGFSRVSVDQAFRMCK